MWTQLRLFFERFPILIYYGKVRNSYYYGNKATKESMPYKETKGQ
jgi:hypothetical protein